ncbi:MAG: cyclopropane fatty acyl phospholipid synthase [Verrucomicrobiaceae bacterium]|nr:MAG: cyclopropane fatty acyl phospholipid synthase [Verrucomicrobiaceae bacterium]
MAYSLTSTHSLPATRAKRALREEIEHLLGRADIRINGSRPWDMRILREGVLERAAARGSLGLGEAYMDGDWEAGRLDELFARVLRARLDREVKPLRLMLPLLRARICNLQNTRRAWRVGEVHYDLGNDFYQAMLGPSMTYSCGYWKNAATLDEAQAAKLDLICRKLDLKPGMRLLDIGCGWGSLMAHAARHYGAQCVGITISKEQAAFVRDKHRGLPVEARLQDYRDLRGRFDRIASIGMFEHVGHKNHRSFMRAAHRCLADDGVFLLHTIGKNERGNPSDPWIERYIFPNGEVPALGPVGDAIDGLFVAEDMHNFGADYDQTLMAWHGNFEAAWPRFANAMGERFHRMWRYYLLSCAGAFRARDMQVWQWTLTKNGLPGGWPRVD